MKTKFLDCFIGLALLASVHSTLAQVTNLGIAPAAGGQVVFYWPRPVNTTNYVLQSTTNLASPNWVGVRDAFAVTAVIVSNISPASFFRLAAVVPAGMALIPAGPFTMGDAVDNNIDGDAAPTNVTVSAFYMDTNLVSFSQWQSVYSYATNNGYNFVNAGSGKATNQPVQTVDWYDCVKWCNARSQQAGLTPAYYTDAGLTQVYTNGETDAVYVNWLGNGYRLPTEAEWEKAARGGLSGKRFPWGNTIDFGEAMYTGQWSGGTNPPARGYDYGLNGFNPVGSTGTVTPYTTPVGFFPENGYGLHDMAGNVDEWCWDWYAAPPYPAGSPYLGGADPHGPTSPTGERVVRGGSWEDVAYSLRTACRLSGYAPSPPNTTATEIGFRCVRGL